MDLSSARMCRICEQTVNLQNMLLVTNKHHLKQYLAFANFQHDDPLPKFICDVCLVNLKKAYLFKVQCDYAQKKFYMQIQGTADLKPPTTNYGATSTSMVKPSNNPPSANAFRNANVTKNYTKDLPFKSKLLIHHQQNGQTLLLRKVKFKGKTYSNTNQSKATLSVVPPQSMEQIKTERQAVKTMVLPPSGDQIKTSYQKQVIKMNVLPLVDQIKVERQVIDTKPSAPSKPSEAAAPLSTTPSNDVQKQKAQFVQRHRNYQCELCLRLFRTQLTHSSHMKWHESPRDEPVACPVCNKTFARPILERHISCVHRKEKPFLCDDCGKAYGQRSELMVHFDKEHIKQLKYPCPYCPQKFFSTSCLSGHKIAKHPAMVKKRINLNPNRTQTKRIRENKRKYTKRRNGYVPDREKNKARAKELREKADELLRLKLPPLCCAYCGAMLGDLAEKQRHESQHIKDDADKRYKCDICGHWVKKLAVHKLRHTDISRPHQCAVCGQLFGRQTQLVVHELLHNGVKLFSCDVCGKKYTYMTMMKIHQRSHTGEKPYKCAECGEQFKSTFLRQRHGRQINHQTKMVVQIAEDNKL